MNPQVGRAVLCAPRRWKDVPWGLGGAHGVTRPTLLRFRRARRDLNRGNLSMNRRADGPRPQQSRTVKGAATGGPVALRFMARMRVHYWRWRPAHEPDLGAFGSLPACESGRGLP